MTIHQPGTEIAGYRIESLIGRGGMAVVYRAEDPRLGRKVALKLLTPQLADSDQFRQRFMRESRLAASLDHPNIVPIYEAGEAEGQLFIAMRYVVGSDLKGVLADAGGRLPVDRTLQFFAQIGDALDSAHQAGLVHRDVKPGNILVAAAHEHTRSGYGDHVYLTDFGLTKRTAELSGGLTGTGHFLGTVDYVSPEQIQGRPVGPGTDIYALGCMLHECLTGRLPFRRDDDAALLWAHLVETPPPVTGSRPELPGAVNTVVARAMAKDPADRYQSCHELLHDLELALGVPAPVSSPRRRDSRDSTGATHGAAAASDGSRTELGTVTGDVLGGGQHPSFPPGPLGRYASQAGASAHGSAPPGDPDRGLGEQQDPDSYRQGYEDVYREEYPDDYRDGYPDEYRDADAGWDQGESGPPPAPPRRQRRWKPVAIGAAVAVVLVAVAAVLLRTTLLSEDYRTYASGGTLVPFTLEHPADWASAVGPSSDVVLAPDPTAADQLFFFRGTPDAWATATGTVQADAPENVWLYVYTAAATFDTSSAQALQDSVVPLLPMSTRIESGPRQVSVAGGQAQEMEAVTSDPENPQTALRALVDVVQPPGAGGAVLLAFFAPPAGFEEHRPTFERIRDSLQITR